MVFHKASLVVVVCSTCNVAAAGTLSITLGAEVVAEKGKLVATVHVQNNGSEPVFSVIPIVRARDLEMAGAPRQVLPPQEGFDDSVELAGSDFGKLQGEWPLYVEASYTDAHEHPFQALHVMLLQIGGGSRASAVTVRFGTLAFSDRGRLGVSVRNVSNDSHELSVAVAVPSGLQVSEPSARLMLVAREEHFLPFWIVNRSVPPMSRYPVFVVAEYDAAGHHTVIEHGYIDIGPAKSAASLRQLAWTIAGLLVMLWGVVVLKRRKALHSPRTYPPAK